MNQDLDLTVQRRSFRDGQRVYNIALEAAWWKRLDRTCGRGALKDWSLIWVLEAYDRGVDRQALIRLKIHEMVLEEAQEEAQAHKELQELLRRIEKMRAKKMPWTTIANALADCELIPNWSTEDLRKFYHRILKRQLFQKWLQRPLLHGSNPNRKFADCKLKFQSASLARLLSI